MRSFNQFLGGLLAVIVSTFIVAGAFLLALVENGASLVALTTPSVASTAIPETHLPDTIIIDTPTRTATAIPSPTSTLPPRNRCAYPLDWMPYVVQGDDTLASLADRFGATLDQLRQGNCLFTDELKPGWIIYLPPATPVASHTPTASPSPSPTPRSNITVLPTTPPCGPPAGWVRYTIQPGDTLFSLSRLLSVSVSQLQTANCMGGSTILRLGSVIYVPFVPPTRTPLPPSATPILPTNPPPTPGGTTVVITSPPP